MESSILLGCIFSSTSPYTKFKTLADRISVCIDRGLPVETEVRNTDPAGVERVMLSVAHVRSRPYPEMFGGILGSLDAIQLPGCS